MRTAGGWREITSTWIGGGKYHMDPFDLISPVSLLLTCPVLVIESTGVANFSAGASIATSGTLMVEGTLAMHGEHIYIHEMNVTTTGVVDVTCAAASASDHACGSFDHVVLAGTLRGMYAMLVCVCVCL